MSEQKEKTSAVDEIIRKARSGEAPTKGQFTLDPRVAKEQMKAFRLEDPWSYAVEFFLAASRKGGSLVKMTISPGQFEMRFDGPPFTQQDLENIYSDLFSGKDADPNKRANGQLAMALNALSALRPRLVEVFSGDAECAVHLIIRPGEEDKIETAEAGFLGTRVTARLGGFESSGFYAAEGARQSIALLAERCRYAVPDLIVNEKEISSGFQLPDAAAYTSFREGTLEGVAGLIPQCAVGEVRFVVEGILVETVHLSSRYAGVAVIVQDEAFQKDLSNNRVIKDEAYTRAITAAETAARQALGLVRQQTSELYLYSEGPGETENPTKRGYWNVDKEKSDLRLLTRYPALYLSRNRRLAAALFYRVKRLMRPLVKVLYFSWLLLVPKLITLIFGTPVGDWATVIFSILAVAFFFMLGVLAILHVFAGPRSARQCRLRLAFNTHDPADALRMYGIHTNDMIPLKEARAAAPSKTPLRVVGTVNIEDDDPARDRTVFTDIWRCSKTRAIRLLSTRPFSLAPDERSHAAVMVDMSGGTWVIGDYQNGAGRPALLPDQREKISQWLARNSPDPKKEDVPINHEESGFGELPDLLKNGTGFAVREGDRLEIIAPGGAWTNNATGSTGVRLAGNAAVPLLVRILSSTKMGETAP